MPVCLLFCASWEWDSIMVLLVPVLFVVMRFEVVGLIQVVSISKWDTEASHSISAWQGVPQLCMLVSSFLGYLFE